MKNELLERIKIYCDRTEIPNKMYFSKFGTDRKYIGYKYFFKFHNTNKVVFAFKTLKELENFLDMAE